MWYFFILFIWVCVICGYNVWPNYCIIRTVNRNKFTLSQLEFFWFKPFPVYSDDCIGVWPHILEECRVDSTEHNKKKEHENRWDKCGDMDFWNLCLKWINTFLICFYMFLYVFEVKYWLFGTSARDIQLSWNFAYNQGLIHTICRQNCNAFHNFYAGLEV